MAPNADVCHGVPVVKSRQGRTIEALLEQRRAKLDEAARGLGGALSAERAAAGAAAEARTRVARIVDEGERARREARELIEAGQARAVDLARECDQQRGVAERLGQAKAAAQAAEKASVEAKARVVEATTAVAQRQAEAKIAEKLRQREQSDRLRRELAGADEAAEDAFAARNWRRA